MGTDGAIDWCCLPHFDSPSVFAAILDDKKGGTFKIAATGDVVSRQYYHPETNVLMTYFASAEGVALVEDLMPVNGIAPNSGSTHTSMLVRRVTGVRDTSQMRLECFPAFDYARMDHTTHETDTGVVFEPTSGRRLGLAIPVPYARQGTGVVADFEVAPGQSVTFVLGEMSSRARRPMVLKEDEARGLVNSTIEYWRRWLSKCTYRGRWREMVHRSVLTLKLLTFEPTGAIVAAPTCSLPEAIGGVRNWDYRFTWMRDAAFTLYAFMRVGLTEEAGHFMEWIQARTSELSPEGTPKIMYRLDGSHVIEEENLDNVAAVGRGRCEWATAPIISYNWTSTGS